MLLACGNGGSSGAIRLVSIVLGIAYGALLVWLVMRTIIRPRGWSREKKIWAWLLIVVFPATVFVTLRPLVVQAQEAARRSSCNCKLKQIGLALHNYHEQFGCLPPAYILGPDGMPWHSWRVLILPYLDRQELYNAYKFDEPWNGPNNSKLAGEMAEFWACPSDPQGGRAPQLMTTNYVAVVGPATAWPGSRTVTFKDFTDGSATTLLVVEAVDTGIHWMEPADLSFTQMSPTINSKLLPGISSRHSGGACVLMGDGSVRFLNNTVSPTTLHGLLTRNGGEAVGADIDY